MNKSDTQAPSFTEVYLAAFVNNNPHAEVLIDGESLIVDKPWMRDDARLKGGVKDSCFVEALNALKFSPRFDALFHVDKNIVEFVYGYINPESESNKDRVDRTFVVYYEGKSYKCYFSEPSDRLMKIASTFERVPSDSGINSVPQIIPFRQVQVHGEKNEKFKSYLENKVPRSFYIECEAKVDTETFENVARHVNFMMSYYDREAPIIVINPHPEQGGFKNKKPLRYIEGSFPNAMIAHTLDDIVLKLIEVARESDPRFAFLYYYQVFEYAGYYYVDEAVKRQLRSYLKDPALINCGEDKVSELFALFADLNHGDDMKMKKVIEEHCDPAVIWKEIENDKEFFSGEQAFDGGFKIKGLVSADTSQGSWESMWMPKLYDYLTKIRNSLVHAREKRESKVILPTRKNNLVLSHYIPLIRRVAEQVALKTQ